MRQACVGVRFLCRGPGQSVDLDPDPKGPCREIVYA